MKQSHTMSLVEALANVAVGYSVAVVTQILIFPIFGLHTTLAQNPKIKIEIQGHTDNKGSAVYNKKLSDRRAASVLKYLVAKGIDPSRLTSHGYGMEVPIVPNTTDQNRALNRRVQFVRTEGQK